VWIGSKWYGICNPAGSTEVEVVVVPAGSANAWCCASTRPATCAVGEEAISDDDDEVASFLRFGVLALLLWTR